MTGSSAPRSLIDSKASGLPMRTSRGRSLPDRWSRGTKILGTKLGAAKTKQKYKYMLNWFLCAYVAFFQTYFSTDCRIFFKILCWRWVTVFKWLWYAAGPLKFLLQILQRGFRDLTRLANRSSSSELDSSGSSIDNICSAAASPPPKITRSWSCWHRFKWNLSALRTLTKGTLVLYCRRNWDWYMLLNSDSSISFFNFFFSRNWMNVWATPFSSLKDLVRNIVKPATYKNHLHDIFSKLSLK